MRLCCNIEVALAYFRLRVCLSGMQMNSRIQRTADQLFFEHAKRPI